MIPSSAVSNNVRDDAESELHKEEPVAIRQGLPASVSFSKHTVFSSVTLSPGCSSELTLFTLWQGERRKYDHTRWKLTSWRRTHQSLSSISDQCFTAALSRPCWCTFPMSKDGVSGATIQETGAGRGSEEVRRRKEEASQLLKDPHWMDDGDLKATTTGHVGNSPKCSDHYVTMSNQFDWLSQYQHK